MEGKMHILNAIKLVQAIVLIVFLIAPGPAGAARTDPCLRLYCIAQSTDAGECQEICEGHGSIGQSQLVQDGPNGNWWCCCSDKQ